MKVKSPFIDVCLYRTNPDLVAYDKFMIDLGLVLVTVISARFCLVGYNL
jgi:hypothetical protein